MARRDERADSGRVRAEGRRGDDDRCGDEDGWGEEERINGSRAKTLFSESASTDEPNTPESESDNIDYSRGGRGKIVGGARVRVGARSDFVTLLFCDVCVTCAMSLSVSSRVLV